MEHVGEGFLADTLSLRVLTEGNTLRVLTEGTAPIPFYVRGVIDVRAQASQQTGDRGNRDKTGTRVESIPAVGRTGDKEHVRQLNYCKRVEILTD